MTIASNLGFPRIGRRRELKATLERHWAGELSEAELQAEAARLRAAHWQVQQGSGISHVPSGDFSLYDHVLDTACMLGAVPRSYGAGIRHVDAIVPFPSGIRRCGRSSGVPTPTYG